MLNVLSMHFVSSELLNEFVIELAVQENAREVIESMGFQLVRKVIFFILSLSNILAPWI